MMAAAVAPWRDMRRRWTAWWLDRLPRTDRLTLTHRNLYILPSRSGWSLAAVTLVLLLASINEQVNLGYALAFALAGAALAALHQTHGNLQGLVLQMHPPASVHAGQMLVLRITLDGGARTRGRYGLHLRATPGSESAGRGSGAALDVEVAPGDAQWVELEVPAPARGLCQLPCLGIDSRYPLGIFRVWAWWRPNCEVLVWPAIDHGAPSLLDQMGGHGESGDGMAFASLAQDIPEGLRAYRRGDPMHWIAWRKSGGREDLISRERLPETSRALWLDYSASPGLAGLGHEQRLSRLSAWVLEAERLEGMGLQYGLRLPSSQIKPGRGAAHLRQCLDTLARCETLP